MVIRIPAACVIAVRGTHSLADVLLDLRATKIQTTIGTLHTGFGQEATDALPRLQKLVGNDLPLYFTGHSMGAAVAAILPRIWTGSIRLMTPYLFASPRFAGRKSFTPRPSYSYVRPLDVIPYVPPSFFGYQDNIPAPQTVPSSARRHGWIGCSLATLKQLFATHSIEGYRVGLGREVARQHRPGFDEKVYVRLLGNLHNSSP